MRWGGGRPRRSAAQKIPTSPNLSIYPRYIIMRILLCCSPASVWPARASIRIVDRCWISYCSNEIYSDKHYLLLPIPVRISIDWHCIANTSSCMNIPIHPRHICWLIFLCVSSLTENSVTMGKCRKGISGEQHNTSPTLENGVRIIYYIY